MGKTMLEYLRHFLNVLHVQDILLVVVVGLADCQQLGNHRPTRKGGSAGLRASLNLNRREQNRPEFKREIEHEKWRKREYTRGGKGREEKERERGRGREGAERAAHGRLYGIRPTVFQPPGRSDINHRTDSGSSTTMVNKSEDLRL